MNPQTIATCTDALRGRRGHVQKALEGGKMLKIGIRWCRLPGFSRGETRPIATVIASGERVRVMDAQVAICSLCNTDVSP